MHARLEYMKVAPELFKALKPMGDYIKNCGLEQSLIDLVMLRASQINGCAYCIDMHTKDARARGETEQRLYALDAWRETPFYTEQERAALAWTEAVTLITHGHAADEVYESVRRWFTETELANLTAAVALINAWNRLAIAARSVPGEYQPIRARKEKTTERPEAAYH